MTDQEINEAIALHLGWVKCACKDPECGVWWPPEDGDAELGFPNYCNDLNAMHEAEKVLANQCKEHDYWFFMRQSAGFPDAECDWDEVLYFNAVHATARQRAEAFLRTIGKWRSE